LAKFRLLGKRKLSVIKVLWFFLFSADYITEKSTEYKENTQKITEVQNDKDFDNKNSDNKNFRMIEINPLSQYLELATGYEITSLTMLLNYLGFNADRCDLADNYLDKGPVGTVDFRKAFEGETPEMEILMGVMRQLLKTRQINILMRKSPLLKLKK